MSAPNIPSINDRAVQASFLVALARAAAEGYHNLENRDDQDSAIQALSDVLYDLSQEIRWICQAEYEALNYPAPDAEQRTLPEHDRRKTARPAKAVPS